MATYKFILFAGNERKDGSFPVSIRITKERKSKLIRTGLVSTKEQWNESDGRFVSDKKIVPKFKIWNARLSEIETQINEIFRNFEIERVDWTLNQFEEAFLNKASKGKVKDYFNKTITTLKDTGHVGNSVCYSRTLHMLEECKGNTRKYYFKALRAILNKAIQDQEASEVTYPFGKGGFNISALEEETAKRYLPHEDMDKLKHTAVKSHAQELARRLFLFSYYCYGISFIDAALLTKNNIIRYNGGSYIVYKRNKTKEAKKVKPIQIKITSEIQELMDWFASNTILVEDYLLPIVSIPGYKGEQLYNHIRSRFGRNNKNLANLAQTLGITDMKLTSYVSRHTMAMTLQDNQVPREVISQILGHSDLSTTNTYLDSFASSVIDEAVKVL